ncbi:MAG: M4 family metallopeptidase [Actinomycetota bacterium]
MPGRRILALTALLGLLVSSVALRAAEAGTSSSSGRALSRLAEDSTRTLVARSDPAESVPSFVTGRILVTEFSSSGGAAARGWDFWEAYGRAFGVADARSELALRSIERDDLGMTHLTYDQRHRGLPVFGRQMLLHLDGNAVTVVNGEFTVDIELSTTPAVSAREARTAARAVPARDLHPAKVAPELLVFVDGAERARLAWRVSIVSERPLGLWRVFVEARTGDVLRFYNDLHTAKNRRTHTNANDPDCNTQDAPQCTLPGTLVRSEGDPATGDAVVDNAHTHTGTVYDYYFTNFARDSYDGAGHHMRSTVHFGSGYNNAFWCPSVGCAEFFGSTPDGEQMVYGDGDGVVFSPLGSDIDVVAHELTHAVTENEANLTYLDQSGALNESYSDVFAAMVDTDNWLIGEDSFTPGTPGDALRDMVDPSNGDQPGHMSEFVETIADNGGVHINSGIPNHAAYLTSEDPGYGIGRAATEDIYYRALTTYLTPSSDFLDNLNALLQSADDLFPGTAEMSAVAKANAAVGIANPPVVTFPNGGESLPTGSGTTITWTTDDNARPFKVSYLRDMGSTTYTQGFEGGATLPAEFTTAGNAPWSVSTVDPAPGGGIRNARSGVIPHNGRSELTLNIRLATNGSVGFRYRVSSEANFDFLSFHVDGDEQFRASGNEAWASNSETLSAGTHTLTWVYEKDFTIAGGSDVARIDDISISNAENVTLTTIKAATAPGATSESWTTPASGGPHFKVRTETLGVAPWYSTDDSNATFTVTDADPPETTITSGPSGATDDSSPTFGFTSDEPGTFACRVDASPFASCTSPHTTATLADGAHTFEVGATDFSANTDPSPDSRSFTVTSPPPPTSMPGLSIGNAKRKEPDRGKKMMKLRVTLSEPVTSPVTVDFATANGSAKAPRDFKAVQGTLTFAPGTTLQVIKVPVKGDLREERNERFSVLLSGPTGATIADGTAIGKILDND